MCRGSGTCGKRATSGRGKIGMTGGMVARDVPARRRATLAADDLGGQVAGARPVELGGDDGLELAEHELAPGDREGERVSEQGGLQVGVRVLAVAVGVGGVVVAPV